MPELPEVETTLRGIAPYLLHNTIANLVVRNRQLRWPVPSDLDICLNDRKVTSAVRRAKYLLLCVEGGALMIHLGMSGSLRVCDSTSPIKQHDHIDLIMSDGVILRYHDPRRFGSWLWVQGELTNHPLLTQLGPEPLGEDFDGEFLFQLSRGKKKPMKTFLMDNHIVVGVGNIYANESLFLAGVNPHMPAGELTQRQADMLVKTVKQVLAAAIEQGGTTLRDFVNGNGEPGYFQQKLHVYGRGGEPCSHCGECLKESRLGQRATVYCAQCQPMN